MRETGRIALINGDYHFFRAIASKLVSQSFFLGHKSSLIPSRDSLRIFIRRTCRNQLFSVMLPCTRALLQHIRLVLLGRHEYYSVTHLPPVPLYRPVDGRQS